MNVTDSRSWRCKLDFSDWENVGSAMAAKMLKGGHQLRVRNRPPPVGEVYPRGRRGVTTPAEAFDVKIRTACECRRWECKNSMISRIAFCL
jgi:hypothetical protein